MSDVRVAQQLLSFVLPGYVLSKVDLGQLRRISTAHISGRFGVSFSDVMYEAPLIRTDKRPKRVIFLFEHKSSTPRTPIHLQLLDYMMQQWEDDLRQQPSFAWVIPIVIYHGKRPWHQEDFHIHFEDLFEEWRPFIPSFHYIFVDLNRIPAEVFERNEQFVHLAILALTLKFARDWQQLARHLPVAPLIRWRMRKLAEPRDYLLLQSWFFYLSKLLKMNDIRFADYLELVPEDVRESFEALKRMYGPLWEQELLHYEREMGRAEGREEEKQMAIASLLRNFPDWTDAWIASLLNTTEEKVAHIRREIYGGNGQKDHQKET